MKNSYSCVIAGSIDPNLYCQPFHLRSFCSHPLVFYSFLPICHVERTCRQNRTQCGTVVYLNPLMGSMGFAVLLEH